MQFENKILKYKDHDVNLEITNDIYESSTKSSFGGVFTNDGTWPGTNEDAEDAHAAVKALRLEIEARENPGPYPFISKQREDTVRMNLQREFYQEAAIMENLRMESYRNENEISYWKRRLEQSPILKTLTNLIMFGVD